MRPDMFKVIVERPRGCGGARHRDRGPDYDDLPSFEGMRRIHHRHGGVSYFNDHLGPLRRFLNRRVGRRWNEVYAEICANLRPQSTVQQHLRDHVHQYVDRKVFVATDGSLRSVGCIDHRFHVDPTDGVLYRTLRSGRPKAPAAPRTHIVLGHERELIKVEGIWYWAVFASVSPPERRVWRVWNKRTGSFDSLVTLVPARVVDIVTGKTVTRGRYRHAKRQANKRDLRRYGLANEVR